MLAIVSLLTFGLAAEPVPRADTPKEDNKSANTLLVRGEKVYVRPDRVLENAAVLIRDGVVVAVGQGLQAPEGAREISGKIVCPGFVDAWSAFAVDPNASYDERVGPMTAALDAVDPFIDARFERALLAAGITTYRVQPSAIGRSAGLGALLRLNPDRDLKQTTLLADCCLAFALGISRARPLDLFDRVADVDRIVSELSDGLSYLTDTNEYKHELAAWEKKIAEKQKELDDGFKKAKKDREKAQTDAKDKGTEFKDKEYKEDKKPKAPRFDEEKEMLARVASGELPLVVEVHRALEIRNLLQGTAKFERLRLVLAGGTEACACAEELKARHVPVIVWPQPLAARAQVDEFEHADLSLAGELEEAGVEVILGSGASAGIGSRDLPLLAALAVGHGLSPQAALAALTTRPARALDASTKVGSLELGHDGDVLVLDGEPFAATTKVRFVVSGGDVVVGGQ